MERFQQLAAVDPTRKAASLFEEFRNFALKGNVIDLAVGVIIGAAFGKIVDSLVKHIFMPAIASVMPGDKGYVAWKLTLNGTEIPYGLFLGEVVNFVIVAAVLFLFIKKFLKWVMTLRDQEEATPTPPTKYQELLMEIRDLLKSQASATPNSPAQG